MTPAAAVRRALPVHRTLAGLLVGLLLALLLGTALVTPASAEVRVTSVAVETPDPRAVTFRARVEGDPVHEAMVVYRVLNPDGAVGGDLRAEVPSDGRGDLSVTLQTNTANTYIPVGSQISYWWEFTTRDGETSTTEQETFVFLDGRHQWQALQQGDVTLYWYADESAAALALQATADAIADVERLLAVELPYPVRVVVWPRESEGEMAQRPRASTFDSQVITGGSRVSADVLHIYDALGSFVDVARHEAAHLVTRVAGDGPFTRVPSWLDEGVAVYAQNDPGVGYRTAVEFAIQSDNTLRLRNLSSATNQASLVNTFYGQSWHVVDYLVSTYGEDALAQAFATVKAGSTTDQALTEVYGFDQDGLYNEWRESVGLPRLEFAAVPTATPRAEGTRPPLALPTSITGGQSSGGASPGGAPQAPEAASDGATAEDGGASDVMTAAVLGLVTLVLAGGLGFAGMRLMRSK